MRFSLRQKLSISICILVLGLMAFVLAIIHVSVSRFTDDEGRRGLRSAQQLFRESQHWRDRELETMVKTVSEAPQLKAVVTTADLDHATLLDSAASLKEMVRSDLFMLADSQGKLLASVTEPAKYMEDVGRDPAFSAALRGELFGGFWADAGSIYQIVAGPVTVQDEIVGAVVIGFMMHPTLVQNIEELTDCRVAVIKERVLVTSLSSAPFFEKFQMQADDKSGRSDVILTRKVNRERFLTLRSQLGSEGVSYVLARSLDRQMLFYRGLEYGLIAAGVLILLVALVLAIFLSKKITEPIQVLVEKTQSLAKGDLTTRAPVLSEDEIGQLAQAFNRMVEDFQKTTVSRDALLKEIAERKRMEDIALQSEKMAAVGQLAAGIAHEINNPLGVILGFSQALVRRLSPGDLSEMPLKSIEREAVRCKQLVQDLLTFSRIGRTEKEKISINEAIESSMSLIIAQSRVKKVELVKELKDALPLVMANKTQIQQIVINLANNAIDAMPDGGKVIFKSQKVRRNEKDFVEIQVQDTGEGIPPDIQSKILEPFFTTKGPGKGTGLGLSLVYEIVQKHDGRLTFESQVGRGTVFHVELPAAAA